MFDALLTLSGNDLWQRLTEGHGFLITFIGLTAVFSGLCILWLATSAFPRLIAFFERRQYQRKAGTSTFEKGQMEDTAIAAAIGVALCCELEDEEISVLTLRHIEQEMSPWVVAAKSTTMRHF